MTHIRFTIERSEVGNVSDVVRVRDDESPLEALVNAVVEDVRTDIQITIGGVTMFLAAWQDPGHWASDWAEKLSIGFVDVEDAVMALLTQAEEPR